MNEMIAADGQTVPVPGNHHNLQVWPGKRQPGRKGNGPSVRNVVRIRVDVSSQPSGATNAGYDRQIVLGNPAFVYRPEQRSQGDSMTASRTKKMRQHPRP